jgi:hypothetical protein
MSPLLLAIAQAIAQKEGFYVSGSIAQRNNNPGNLRSWGSNPIVSGYAKFATIQDGWNALYSQINKNIGRGLTLNEFFAGKPGVYPGYSPSSDNNQPIAYAAFVGSQVGIPVDTPLSQIDPSTLAVSVSDPSLYPTNDINSDPSQSGQVDYTGLVILGLGLLAAWYFFSEG